MKRLYYGIQQAESALRAAEETVKLYREVEALTGRYLAEQTALKSDHLDAQRRLARAELDHTSIQDQIDLSREQLNRVMGRDVLTVFSVAPPLEATDIESDAQAARRLALERRPEIRQARLKVEQALQDRRVKKAEYIPEVSLAFNSISLVNFSGFIPSHFNSAGLNASWEPFDWGRRKHELAEKDRIIEQARNSVADAESAIIVEVNDGFRKLRQYRGQLRVARLEQETATENLRVVQEKFKLQALLMKDVLQAQAGQEQASSSYRQALASYWTAKADFERAIGEDQ